MSIFKNEFGILPLLEIKRLLTLATVKVYSFNSFLFSMTPFLIKMRIYLVILICGILLGFQQKSLNNQYVEYDSLVKSDVFQVKVNGKKVFTAKEYCFGDSIFHTSQFFVEGETEIVIECVEPIEKFEIRPFSKKIKGVVQGNQLRFKVSKPEMLMITVNYFKPLCLFQTPPETDIPDPNDPNVIYFKKGGT